MPLIFFLRKMLIAMSRCSGVAGATPLHYDYPPRYVTSWCMTLPHLTRYTCSACYGHVVLSLNIGAIS